MSDLVSVASSAVNAYQRALGTVSNNIANVDTEGYSKQEVELNENSPRPYGTAYLGTGVRFDGVRRLYDAFVEDSLRNANTDLGTQESLVNYANRVINILGSEDVGLTAAFDRFFSAARSLSTDPSSLILREQFLSKSEGLAGQFSNLSNQLDLVESETREATEASIGKINQLAEQLAVVNRQLRKSRYADRQPPALMDQRDLILRDLAQLARIQVKEATNGEVTVSLGSTIARGVLVNTDGARRLGAQFSETSAGKVDLIVGQYSSDAEAISGLSGGELAGLLQFRSQLLEPVYAQLDNLATNFVAQVNDITESGIDLSGKTGGELFTIDPRFTLSAVEGQTEVAVNANITDFGAYVPNNIELSYRSDQGQINDLSLSGDFLSGDQITITLNGNSRSFTAIGSSGALGEPLALDDVLSQLTNFLQGGNADSVDGAFGRQISVEQGAANDILISSQLFGAFTLDVSTTSQAGRIGNSEQRGLWTARDALTGHTASGREAVDINGMKISMSGNPREGEILTLSAQNRPAAGVRLQMTEPGQVVAASRFRVIENQFNPGGVQATLTEAPVPVNALDESLRLDQVRAEDGSLLDNNINPDEAISFSGPKAIPLARVPAGHQDVAIYLGELGGDNLSLQVFTREGQHLLGGGFVVSPDRLEAQRNLLGREDLTETELRALQDELGEEFLDAAKMAGVNISSESLYSSQYLNVGGAEAYRGLDLFYGVKASVLEYPVYSVDHVVERIARDPAKIESGTVRSMSFAVGEEVISEGALTLNGVALGGLRIERNENGNASFVITRTLESGAQVELPLKSLVPDFQVTEDNGMVEVDAGVWRAYLLAHNYDEEQNQPVAYGRGEAWNGLSYTHNMSIDVVELDDGTEGLEISRAIDTREAAVKVDSEVRIGLGSNGSSADLANIGFRTAAYLSGTVPEDLYVFATGDSDASFSLGATYTEGEFDLVKSMREQPFEVLFNSESRYQIIDVTTQTVLAERTLGADRSVTYRGIRLDLTAVPSAGDRFLVDGNSDGVGNNGAALRLAALQNEPVMGGGVGQTFQQAYAKVVGDVGDVAFQATIAQKALQVVKDQAVQARDKVSGVSLDEEAADLIRFQQAYQASAKVMQTANTLFDAILGIR